MGKRISRRDVLKLLAAGTAGLLLPRVTGSQAREKADPLPPEPQGLNAGILQSRVIHTIAVYKEADATSERVGTYYRDETFPILEEVRAPYSAHNDLWYRIPDGYVHSAWVLPVMLYPEQPFHADIGEWGFWGEVSAVSTEARTAPGYNSPRKYTFYASTVFHVIDAALDDAGNGWYKVFDDYPPRQRTNFQWVPAKDIRAVPRVEMAPIHPFAGDKRIEIELGTQTLTCFEGDNAVFSTLTASGLGANATPTGDFCVLLKQASRHMANVPYPDMDEELIPDPGDIFDLPGVPWNIFFDLKGHAIHGAYWHNDYGIPRSHGCINVPVAAAQYIYRWTYPIAGYHDDFIQSTCGVGTPVIIR